MTNHKLNNWRDMSRQDTILSKLNSNKIWTFPSNDQYLPAYVKRLCDAYQKQPNPCHAFPVEVRKHI